MRHIHVRKRLNAGIVVLLFGTILIGSFYPLSGSGIGAADVNLLLLHGLAYFALAGALLLHFADTPKGHIEAAGAAILIGIFIELLQMPVPTRTLSFTDMAVNTAGAGLILLDHYSGVATRLIELEEHVLQSLLKHR